MFLILLVNTFFIVFPPIVVANDPNNISKLKWNSFQTIIYSVLFDNISFYLIISSNSIKYSVVFLISSSVK